MELATARLQLILHSAPFIMGILLGICPFVVLMITKVRKKLLDGKSVRFRLVIAWAAALLIGAAACFLCALSKIGGYTCGTCAESDLNYLLTHGFGDLPIFTITCGMILSTAAVLHFSKPILSAVFVVAVFPLVVAALSVKPLWQCLNVSGLENRLYHTKR